MYTTVKKYLLSACLTVHIFNFSIAQSFSLSNNDLLKTKNCDIEVADITNDGFDDIVISGKLEFDGGRTQTYRNNGNGGFSLLQSFGLPYVSYSSVTSGDIDGDGDVDLFISGYWGSGYSYSDFQINDGTGHFTEMGGVFERVSLGESKLFDADNDQDLDLLYFGRAESGGRATKLLYNDGAGNYSESGEIFDGYEYGSLDIGDANNDGYLDFIISGQGSNVAGQTQLYLNNGDGTFYESIQNLTDIFSGSCRFIDLELDGDLDLIITGGYGGLSTLSQTFVNDGMGIYSASGNRGIPALRANLMELSDIDLDGDMDLFISGRDSANTDYAGVYMNIDGFFEIDTSFTPESLAYGDAIFVRSSQNCAEDLIYGGYHLLDCTNKIFDYRSENYSSNCPSNDETFEDFSLPEYVVFGSPFNENVIISVDREVSQVHIYDTFGRLIYEDQPNDALLDINLDNVKPGIYYLSFTTVDYGIPTTIKLLKVNYQ